MKGWFRVIEEQREGREQSSGVQLRGKEVSRVEMLGSIQPIFGLNLLDRSWRQRRDTVHHYYDLSPDTLMCASHIY